MTYQEAQQLLDKAKDGQHIPEDVITEALFMTGDGECRTEIPDPEIEEYVQAMRESGAL